MLTAVEFVHVEAGVFRASSRKGSSLVGKTSSAIAGEYRRLMQSAAEVASALPISLSATTSFSAHEFVQPTIRGTAGFVDELYRRVYTPWMNVAQASIPFGVELKLPPLLAIVLSRAPSRERIPEVLSELRQELAGARGELTRLNDLLDSTMSQADVQALVRKVNQAFDAVVPESLLTNAQRRARWFASVFNFARPVRQLYSIAVDPLSANRETFAELFQSAKEAVEKDRRIVARSIAASQVSELLRVDSVRQIVQTQFTAPEIQLIARTSA